VRRRSVRRRAQGGRTHRGGDPRRRVRPRARRGGAAQLAVPARSPHRRLRADHAPLLGQRLMQRMPAEWARHAATWIAWPHNETDWPGKFAPIRWVYGEFVRLVAAHERVRILVSNDAVENEARATLELVGAAANWDFVRVPTNRSWTRDTGPLFVMRDGKKRATHWRFNAWAKYDDWQLDV